MAMRPSKNSWTLRIIVLVAISFYALTSGPAFADFEGSCPGYGKITSSLPEVTNCKGYAAQSDAELRDKALTTTVKILVMANDHPTEIGASDIRDALDTASQSAKRFAALFSRPLAGYKVSPAVDLLDIERAHWAALHRPVPDNLWSGFQYSQDQLSRVGLSVGQRKDLLSLALFNAQLLHSAISATSSRSILAANQEGESIVRQAQMGALRDFNAEHSGLLNRLIGLGTGTFEAMLGAALLLWLPSKLASHKARVRDLPRLILSNWAAIISMAAICAILEVFIGEPSGSLWWWSSSALIFAITWLGFYLGLPPMTSAAPARVRGTHGSAAFASSSELRQTGRVQQEGFVLAESHGFAVGRVPKVRQGFDPRVRYMGNVLTCAPTGAGKGVSAVVPTLLEYPGSALVIDIKGENYAVTSDARRRMGHDVRLIDPFRVVAQFPGFERVKSDGLNWLDLIDTQSPDAIGCSDDLAEMLCITGETPSDTAQHFADHAKGLLRGLLLYIAGTEDKDCRTMGELRRILTLPYYRGDKDDQTAGEYFTDYLADMRAFGGVPERTANDILSLEPRERSAVLSTAKRHTKFLDDTRIADSLSRSDFDIRDLKRKLMTVYIVLPPDRLEANTRFIRGLIGNACAAITGVADKPPYHVLFMLDEFGHLGFMEKIVSGLTLLRGYGARFWVIVQDLSQLRAVYNERATTFLSSCAKQFFSVSDLATAEYVSKSLGHETIQYQTTSENSGSSSSRRSGGSNHVGAGVAHVVAARALLTPDEVMQLSPREEIVLIATEPPARLQKLDYRFDPEYQGLFAPNPLH
jgi:type IV secretory pathway TraG/TraD family ATPase VirD4